MTAFDRLLNSGLPVSWTTILLAWKGLPNVPTPVSNLMTAAQVVAYAMNRIGDSSSEQEVTVARLAFSDERDTWTIQRCLEELASDAPEEVQRAVRVWRWVLLNEIVTKLERQAQNAPEECAPIYGVWADDFRTSVYCDLGDFWAEFAHPSEGFAVTEDWRDTDWFKDILNTLRLIEEHRRWLVQEEVALCGHSPNEGSLDSHFDPKSAVEGNVR